MVNGSEAVGRCDSVAVEFDDERLVANAGLLLTSTLSERLGLERLVEETVDLGEQPGASRPGRKVLSLVHAIAAGADSIDDCDVLRAGGSEAVLGHKAMAPSTLGTFLRAFTFGHVRQLDRVLGESIARAWSAGAGPGSERLVIDVDSFVGEVHGYEKQGAARGYTGELGYHPLLATRAGTGEALHIRQNVVEAAEAMGLRVARGSGRIGRPIPVDREDADACQLGSHLEAMAEDELPLEVFQPSIAKERDAVQLEVAGQTEHLPARMHQSRGLLFGVPDWADE